MPVMCRPVITTRYRCFAQSLEEQVGCEFFVGFRCGCFNRSDGYCFDSQAIEAAIKAAKSDAKPHYRIVNRQLVPITR